MSPAVGATGHRRPTTRKASGGGPPLNVHEDRDTLHLGLSAAAYTTFCRCDSRKRLSESCLVPRIADGGPDWTVASDVSATRTY
jgi:hypothetical protein